MLWEKERILTRKFTLTLKGVYGKPEEGTPEFPFAPTSVQTCPDFTSEELREALRKGRRKVAVGPDMVSLELLQAIADAPEGEEKILVWFNKLLHGHEPIPSRWSRATMVLLPKVSQPVEAKQVRPICIGSATSKVFARMLLARSQLALRYQGSSQCMGEGRQTADYVFSTARLMQLDHEWKSGLSFLKLDVAKAFDTLNRKAFLNRLADKLGSNEILRCWWAMFSSTDAVLSTVWGESVVDMVTGIRQGSVESPQMFAAVIDWILGDVAVKYGWDPAEGPLQGLHLGEIAFVDDLIVWNGDRKGLKVKVTQLAEEMRSWGLQANIKKCQLYVSPYDKTSGKFELEGVELTPDDHLLVMGLPFRSGISPREVMAPIFAKVKTRLWAMKHLFRAKVPLAGRLRLMDRVLGNMALWCSSALHPNKMALQTINVLQSQLVIWSMRLSKKAEEDWLDFRLRCFRSARWAIQRFVGKRWSTQWLQRVWDYAGHRARSGLWIPPTPSGILDSFRPLEWWQREQQSKQGKRHPARFYPRLMGEERELEQAAGGSWRDLAMDRGRWSEKRNSWIEQRDLPWSFHTQLAIEI